MWSAPVLLLVVQLLITPVISQNCIPAKTPTIVRKTISQEEVDKFYGIASEIQGRQKAITDVLIATGVYDNTPMADQFASLHIPDRYAQEAQDNEKLQITKHLLDVNFDRQPHEEFQYEHPPVYSCASVDDRLYDNYLRCDFEGRDKCIYEQSGVCANKYFFRSAAAFTPYTSLVSFRPALDRDRGNCDLPSPRTVAVAIKNLLRKPGLVIQDAFQVPSLFTLTWFQFVAHDSMNIKLHGNDKGTPAPAGVGTDMTSTVPSMISTYYTAPIPVSCNDSFYGSRNITALPFVRAATVQETCRISNAGPVSRQSVLLDLDHVYFRISDGIVTPVKGIDGKFPIGPDGIPIIADPRSKSHSSITAIHLLITRFHDLIVDELESKCGGFTSDELWERAKQIVTAIYQQITYNEVLPAHIGDGNAINASLRTQDPMEEGVVPVIFNEYASACARQLHQFATDKVWFMDYQWNKLEEVPFRSTFHNVDVAKYKWDQAVLGDMAQGWKIDGISDEITDHLFQTTQEYGSDLLATDIQRGRDTGVTSYKEYLSKQTGQCIAGYQDFKWIDGAVEAAQQLYKTEDDVDLYFGVLVEQRHAAMPDTCLKTAIKQFKSIKDGDPKFFTKIFNPQQIEMIGNITIAKLACIFTETKKTLQDGRFGHTLVGNPLVDCPCKTLSECNFDIRAFCNKGNCPA